MINIKLNTVIEWALTINNAYMKTRDYPDTGKNKSLRLETDKR